MGGGGGRQFLLFIYTQEQDLCADTFFIYIVWKRIKLSKCSDIAWCKNSSRITDPFTVVMGLTWCKKLQDNITYLCNVCNEHLRKLPPPPHSRSTTIRLQQHWMLRHSSTTLHDRWATLSKPPYESFIRSLFVPCFPPLSILLKDKKKPWKSYLHKYHNFYCSVHSLWRNIPKLQLFSLKNLCLFPIWICLALIARQWFLLCCSF